MLGTYVLSAGYYDAYYKKAQQVRAIIMEDFKKAFEQVDILATPTSPTVAFKFGEKTEGSAFNVYGRCFHGAYKSCRSAGNFNTMRNIREFAGWFAINRAMV